jgi:microcystin-dependent protein
VAEPFLSEIRIMSFNFPPKGWAFCNGQFLPINQNQALFSLLGTTYGGNGQTTFALPNLQGRVPIHMGSGFTLGQVGGQVTHTVTMGEMPQHFHSLMASSQNGNTSFPANPSGNVLSTSNTPFYRPPDGGFVSLIPSMVSNVGGSQPHTNQQPFLALTFCIALQGIFPSQN